MPEYLHPGVYIEEVGSGPRPIEGVGTSTAGFLGATERGPLRPTLVTSFTEYARWFGGDAGTGRHLPYAARGFFENGGQRLYVCRVVNAGATVASAAFGPHFRVQAIGPGRWGRQLYARITDSSGTVPGPHGSRPVGFRLRLAYYASPPPGDPLDWLNGIANAPVPDGAEDFDDLVLDPAASNHWGNRLEDSTLARLVRSADAAAGASPRRGCRQLRQGGANGGALRVADFEGHETKQRHEVQGLLALASGRCRDVSLVYAPGVPPEIARGVVSHCEAMRYRFALVDGPGSSSAGLEPRVAMADSSNAALYTPWLVVADLADGTQTRTAPPGGHVAGVYVRTDLERGVHTAPADQAVRGALAPTARITGAEQELLNPRGINVLREFPGRGLLVWGARTLSSDPLWKYVNVRRLSIFIERSIDEGTDWVVFEPNEEPLWTRVVGSIRNFLHSLWRGGALAGRTEDEAFFVRCDRTTMTQDDILNGRLICEIGIAVVRPAEFIVLRFGKRTAEADKA
jgi:phage tail sheath protein FI